MQALKASVLPSGHGLEASRHSLSNYSELCAAILKYLATARKDQLFQGAPFLLFAANEVNAFPLAGAYGSTALLKPCAQASGPTMRKNL